MKLETIFLLMVLRAVLTGLDFWNINCLRSQKNVIFFKIVYEL